MTMLRIAAFAAAALLGAAVSAWAGEQGDPNDNCGVGTPQMVECPNAQTAHIDLSKTCISAFVEKAGKSGLP